MIAKSESVVLTAESDSNGLLHQRQFVSALRVFSLFLFVFAHFLVAADPEAGVFFNQQYSPKVYSASPQNWAIAQDRRGIMYFGNTEGVLEYDGASWRKIAIKGDRPALSLALDKNGTLFVGSENELGYLKADSQGLLQYTSLLDRIPKESRNFGLIRSLCADPSGGVWFRSPKYLFHWNSERTMQVISGQSYGRLFSIGADIFLNIFHAGLHRLQNGALVPVPGTRVAQDPAVQGVFQFHGFIIVATADTLYRLTEGGLQKWEPSISEKLRQAGMRGFLPLRNGDLAILTLHSGLLLMDAAGSLNRVVSRGQELRSDVVNSIYEDRQGGVWLALDRGISRVEVEEPATIFGENEGIFEMVTSLDRQDQILFVGTAAGLSFLAPPVEGKPPQFKPVAGIRQTIITLLPTSYGLIAGGIGGIWEVHRDHSTLLNPPHQSIYDLASSALDSGLMYAAGGDGLFVFRRRKSGWEQICEIGANGSEFRNVVEASDGRLWITSRSAILRVDWRQNPSRVERFDSKSGVPSGLINAFRIAGQTVFATSKGLLKFEDKAQRFLADDRFGKALADGSRPVSLIRQSTDGDVWVSGDGYHGVLHKDNQNRYRWKPDPLERSNIKELYALHLDPTGSVWASGMDGGLTRSAKAQALVQQETPVLLRRIDVLTSSRLVFDGETTYSKPLRFRYADNALRFVFVSPNFGDEAHTEYQVYLDGLDHQWSPWSTETQKEYTNLYEKAYKFRVRARGGGGQISPETTFSFRVLPPWYRSWWAFLIYLGVLSAAIVFFINWRLAHLEARNRRLEKIIGDRTLKIRKQRDEIQAHEAETEALLLNILPRQVADELRTTGSVKPLLFNNVAVCFTDFVGFTLSSEQLSAPELVRKLDRYFTAFDEVIGRFGLEKLKTIGDAYMFVGGLPEQKDSYAVDTVMAALELVRVVEDLRRTDPGLDWDIRIGVHCGPVIAGVVGVRKFAFDVWGETVNRASRMESCSKANGVNLSAETYNQVRNLIDCEARGPIATKEGRAFEMYFAKDLHTRGDLKTFENQYERIFGTKPPMPIVDAAAGILLPERN